MIKVLASIALVLLIIILVWVLSGLLQMRWRTKKVRSMSKQVQKDLNDIFEELKREVDKSLEREMRSIVEEKLQASKHMKESQNIDDGEESSNGLKAIEKELKKEIDDVF